MYLVYESLYGELLCDCESANIIGLYQTREQAVEKVKSMIKNELESGDNYVLDEEMNDIDNFNYVRLFYNNQENWNCYYEIHIKKVRCE